MVKTGADAFDGKAPKPAAKAAPKASASSASKNKNLLPLGKPKRPAKKK